MGMQIFAPIRELKLAVRLNSRLQEASSHTKYKGFFTCLFQPLLPLASVLVATLVVSGLANDSENRWVDSVRLWEGLAGGGVAGCGLRGELVDSSTNWGALDGGVGGRLRCA